MIYGFEHVNWRQIYVGGTTILKIRAVSFDAAGTLLENHYRPGPFAKSCAEEIGISVSDQDESAYERLLGRRLPEFWSANQTRDRAVVDDFWLRLTSNWLSEIGSDPSFALELTQVAAVQMTRSDRWFKLFDDVIPALNHLDKLGIDALVLSNWDRSLHDVLEAKGIHGRFKRVVASLEEGVEKPDPNLFAALIAPLGLHPDEVLHIGDDLHDDIEGGFRAGFHVGHLDRSCSPVQTNWLDSAWNPGTQQLHIQAPRLTDFIEVIASF